MGSDKSTLDTFMASNMHVWMQHEGLGVIWFLCSLLLSHGLERTRNEMDMEETPLIGRFGYCSQELINLMLVSKASSNMWNGDKQLGEGEDVMHLKGIHSRGVVGQLTLFEAYGSMEVGSLLKDPEYPIWVVCSESHFTCMFSAHGPIDPHSTKFDLYFYDELVRQSEVIRWSIEPGLRPTDIDCDPPLELVLGTKWKNPRIDWNGAEVLL